jgi:hypothetical protein
LTDRVPCLWPHFQHDRLQVAFDGVGGSRKTDRSGPYDRDGPLSVSHGAVFPE